MGEGFIVGLVYKICMEESTGIRRWNIFRIRFRLRLRRNEKTVDRLPAPACR
jgi:hypothetical protein